MWRKLVAIKPRQFLAPLSNILVFDIPWIDVERKRAPLLGQKIYGVPGERMVAAVRVTKGTHFHAKQIFERAKRLGDFVTLFRRA